VDIKDQYLKKILDNIYDGIYCVDKDRKIIYWNKGAEKFTGYNASEVVGRFCWDNILSHVDKNGKTLCDGLCPVGKCFSDSRMREIDVYLQHKEGHRVPVAMRIVPLQDAPDEMVVAVEILNENSPKYVLYQKVEKLQKLALLDPLVEIGNRRYVEINLRGRLEEMKRYGWPFGVLFIDIDNFKQVNDAYGHNAGDMVLKMLGKTMQNSIRPFDIVGRWGGEEFITLLVNIKQDNLRLVADRIRRLIEQSSISAVSDTIRVTVSIGATIACQNDTIQTLVNRADRFMYQSKTSGKNCVTIDRD
jgi:diguanylate cyclase (GGDEF)-like protein/PAS domain S-box-containing protein